MITVLESRFYSTLLYLSLWEKILINNAKWWISGLRLQKVCQLMIMFFQNSFQYIILGYTLMLKNWNWANAFKQIRTYHIQWPYFVYDFDDHIFISLVLDFCRSHAPREFSKWKYMTWLIYQKSGPFKGTQLKFPRIMEYYGLTLKVLTWQYL